MYVIRSKINNTFYVDSTNDLQRRFAEHNNGSSIYTKKFMPWMLIYYEAYSTFKLAYSRELALKKRAKVWQELTKRLEIEM
jgi:putative endonuclease